MSDESQKDAFVRSLMTDNQYQVISELPDPYGIIERGDVKALCKAKGIGPKSANFIITRFNNRRQFAKVYAKLCPYGMSVESITTLIGKYTDADQLLDRIENDPYLLITEVNGIGWAKADAIAAKVGIVGADPRRVKDISSTSLIAAQMKGILGVLLRICGMHCLMTLISVI